MMLLFYGILCLPPPLMCVAVIVIFALPDASIYTEKREITASERLFAARYNEHYCSTRTLQVCIEDDDPDLFERLVHGDNVSSTSSLHPATSDAGDEHP